MAYLRPACKSTVLYQLYSQIMFDLDKLDPDWTFAQNHGKSCKPGRPIDISGTQFSRTTNLHLLLKHFAQNSKQLQFLGFGFPLFFTFMKYTIIIILLQITSYSALSILWAFQSSNDICSDHSIYHHLPGGKEGICSSWLINFIRTEVVITAGEIILRLSSFIIQICGLVYMRDMIVKTNGYYDERTTSLSDYSLIINNIPKQLGVEAKIRKFFQQGMEEKIKIQDIVMINLMEEYYFLLQQKKSIIKRKKEIINDPSKGDLQSIDSQLQKAEQKIKAQLNNQKEKTKNDRLLCEKAIIILNTEEQKQKLVQIFQRLDKSRLKDYFGQESLQIYIEQAPEPKQIMWENINYPKSKRMFRLFLGWILTFVFLAGITGIFYVILFFKSQTVEHALAQIKNGSNPEQGHSLQQSMLAVTILAMLLIIFFNKFILSFVLHLFTDIEKHQTGSDYEFSFCLKYSLGLFFTTALMTLLVQDIAFHNIYSEQYGVAQEQSIMLFFNAFLVPIIWFIHPWAIYHSISKYFKQGRRDMTQKQANKLMENTKFSMGKHYAQLIESVWFVYLYSSLIPLVAPLMVIGFGISYWISKFNLLRRSSIKQNVNGLLSKKALKLMDATLLLRGIGDLIFDIQIRDGVSWQPILCIILGFVYLFLPMTYILQILHDEKFKAQEKTYKQVQHNFIQNYRTLHPLYVNEKLSLVSGVSLGFLSMQKIKKEDNLMNQTIEAFFDTSKQIEPVQEKTQIIQESRKRISGKEKLPSINSEVTKIKVRSKDVDQKKQMQ